MPYGSCGDFRSPHGRPTSFGSRGGWYVAFHAPVHARSGDHRIGCESKAELSGPQNAV